MIQNKQTILVLASTFPRWSGDTEPRFVFDLSQHLSQYFDVLVLTSHYSGAAKRESISGLKIFRYAYAPKRFEKLVYDGGITTNLARYPWKWLLVPPFILCQLWAILRLLHQYPINVIHAHWLIPQAALALLAKMLSGREVKVISTSHGGDLYGLRGKLMTRIKAWVIRNSDQLTVVSKPMISAALEIEANPSKPIQVIPMGTDLRSTFYQQNIIERDQNLIVFAGRLVEKKGLDVLIKAMPLVLQNSPQVRLVIIGSGPEQTQLEKLVSQNKLECCIEFVGSISHQAMAKWFNQAKMAVLPFRQAKSGDVEGLGLVMVEAMGCGLPVIVGDVPAVHDVVDNQRTGLIIPSNNVRCLAEAIARLHTDQTLWNLLSKNAQLNVLNRFDWRSSVNSFRKLLENN